MFIMIIPYSHNKKKIYILFFSLYYFLYNFIHCFCYILFFRLFYILFFIQFYILFFRYILFFYTILYTGFIFCIFYAILYTVNLASLIVPVNEPSLWYTNIKFCTPLNVVITSKYSGNLSVFIFTESAVVASNVPLVFP